LHISSVDLSRTQLRRSRATVQQRITSTTSGGALNGVTLKGDAGQTQPTVLDIVGAGHRMDLIGDLTLDNTSINLQGGGAVRLSGSAATLAGTDTVLFADNDSRDSVWEKTSGGQLTIGPGITIKGAGGTVGYSAFWGGPSNTSLVNHGTIGLTRWGSKL
jgi:hypothetical protein